MSSTQPRNDQKKGAPFRIHLIACEVFRLEMGHALKSSRHEVKVSFLPKNLHLLDGSDMRGQIQAIIDFNGQQEWDLQILAYGLCGGGLLGIRAGRAPLIIPRVHDCISLLLGGGRSYEDYHRTNPGVYFQSPGWLDGDPNAAPLDHGMDSSIKWNCFSSSLEELIQKYGEERGRYVHDELHRSEGRYKKLTYIEMNLGEGSRYEEKARCKAKSKGWEFEKIPGDMRLIRNLVNGPWSDTDFLRIQPGCRIERDFTGENQIFKSSPSFSRSFQVDTS